MLDWKIMTFAGLAVFFFLLAGWMLAQQRGYRSRGRRRSSGGGKNGNRSTDKRKLNSREKKLFQQAQIQLKQGKVIPAARILEQLNMPREAIQALEDHGEIHEAATILMRMQRQNRAAVVYARHGMWPEAAKCFHLAKMPLEAAKCYRESGDWESAAALFEQVKRYDDAAECFERTGKTHHAARLFARARNREEAVRLYRRVVQETDNLSQLELEAPELEFIAGYLAEGNADLELADLIVNRNKLTVVLHSLISQGFVKQASDIYLRATTDIGPQLISEVSYDDRSAENLAEVFMRVSHFSYAGMVYERMEDFERAGDAFEKAEDFDRAAYCFERSGNAIKVKLLKEKAANTSIGDSETPPAPSAGGSSSPFSLRNVEDTTGFSFDTRTEDDQDTQVIDSKSEIAETPPESAESAEAEDSSAGKFSMADEDDTEEDVEQASSTDQSPAPRLVEETDSSAEIVPSPPDTSADQKAEQDFNPPTQEPVSMDRERAVFHSARFFSDLDFEQKNKLWAIGETKEFAEGETVLDFNDEPQGVYVIVGGHLDVYKLVRSREKYIDRMRQGQSFGELWLLADQPTAVKFVAAKPVKVHVIGREQFDELMDKDGTVARKLYKRFTMRLLRRLLTSQNNKPKSEAS